jgi:hypothetical protein
MGIAGSPPADEAARPRSFDHDEDVDDEVFLIGREGISHILLDEHVLGFEPFLGAAMHEFERMALR